MKLCYKNYFLLSVMLLCAFVMMGTTVRAHKITDDSERKLINVPDYAKTFAGRFHEFIAYDPLETFPDIEIIDFNDNRLNIDAFAGKWVLVNFWATWCPPCIIEIPLLLELKNVKGDENFDVVFISLDFPISRFDMEKRMAWKEIPLETNTYYLDSFDIWSDLDLQSVPTSFIIGPKGKIHFKLVGDIDWTEKESLAFFDELVNN